MTLAALSANRIMTRSLVDELIKVCSCGMVEFFGNRLEKSTVQLKDPRLCKGAFTTAVRIILSQGETIELLTVRVIEGSVRVGATT